MFFVYFFIVYCLSSTSFLYNRRKKMSLWKCPMGNQVATTLSSSVTMTCGWRLATVSSSSPTAWCALVWAGEYYWSRGMRLGLRDVEPVKKSQSLFRVKSKVSLPVTYPAFSHTKLPLLLSLTIHSPLYSSMKSFFSSATIYWTLNPESPCPLHMVNSFSLNLKWYFLKEICLLQTGLGSPYYTLSKHHVFPSSHCVILRFYTGLQIPWE